jgi:hypothetical protein
MTDELPQTFNDFARGVISPETFQHQLLTLCETTPDRAWESLAMLDQHFRRGRIPRELEHSLRHRIERQALGIESYQQQRAATPRIATAPALALAPDADAVDPTIEIIVEPPAPPAIAPEPEPAPTATTLVVASARWRPHFRISRSMALTAVMLALAASLTVKEAREHWLAIDAGAADTGTAIATGSDASATASANQPEASADMLSLSSDRYIIDPDRDVAELSVERSVNAAGDTSFLWWTEASGAKPDQDYIAGKPRRVQMAEGVGSSSLRIPILANPNRHHIEIFYVLIGRPEGNTGVGPIHRAAVFLLPRQAR